MPYEEVTIGPCTLIRADCREIFAELRPVDVLITDPPYGILVPGDYKPRKRDDRGGRHGLRKAQYPGYDDTYANFCGSIVPALNTALGLVRRAAVFTGPHIQEQAKANALGGIYIPMGSGRHEWGFKTFLPILFYGKAPNLQQGARHAIVLHSAALAEHRETPCPKPLPWMRWLVQITSLPRETVLDCFMGSGQTGIACLEAGRRFIGIENDAQPFDVACDHITKAYAQLDMYQPSTWTAPRQLSLA